MGRPSVKEHLVRSSLPLLIERGFQGASVGDLVAAAGVPKGSFYNHFDSKEQFAVEQIGRFLEFLQLRSLRESFDPPLLTIRRHFEEQIAIRQKGLLPLGCLLGTLCNGVPEQYADLRAAVRDGFTTWIDALTVQVDRARVEGDIAVDADSHAIASALVDAFEGAIARARAMDTTSSLEVFLDTTFTALTTKA